VLLCLLLIPLNCACLVTYCDQVVGTGPLDAAAHLLLIPLNYACLVTHCEQVVGTGPLDAAAHLKLLGESLSVIGARLQEHKVTFGYYRMKMHR